MEAYDRYSCISAPVSEADCLHRETAKEIIENTGHLLLEAMQIANMLENGIISTRVVEGNENPKEPRNESMVEMLMKNREYADRILATLGRVREALW